MDYNSMLNDLAAKQAPSEEQSQEVTQEQEQSQEVQQEQPQEAQQEETTTSGQEQQQETTSTSEDSSLTDDQVQSSEQTASEETSSGEQQDDTFVVETDEDMLKFMSDRYEKEFDLEKFKSFVEGKDNTSFANDTVKEINDWVAKGGDLKDYYEFKLTDYNSLDDLDVVKREYKQKYPSLSNEQLERKLTRDFKLDEDKFDEDEIEDAKIDLKLRADEARKSFLDKANQYPASLESKAKEQQQTPEISQEEVRAFQESVSTSLKNLKKIEGPDGFTYEVKDNLKGKVETSPVDLGELFVEGDNFNYDKYNEARYLLNNFNDILQSAIAHGESLGLKKVKEQRNNSTYEESPREAPQVSTERESLEKLSRAFGASGGMRI